MSMMENMKMGKRITMAFGLVMVLLMMMIFLSLRSIAKLDKMVDETVDQANKLQIAASLSEDVRAIGSQMANMILQSTPEGKKEAQEAVDIARTHYKKSLEILQEAAKTTRGRDLLNQVETSIADRRESNLKLTQLAMACKNTEATKVFI